MAVIEPAAEAIAHTMCGREVADGFAANAGIVQDHLDGLQGRIMGKICSAATKLSLGKANEIINNLLAEYDNKEYYKTALAGKKFQECYDTASVKPTEEHLKVYEKVMKRLEDDFGFS